MIIFTYLDLVGVNDPSEEVVTATSDHEEDLFVPLLQGKKLLDLQARLNASKQLNKDIVKKVDALTAFRNSCKIFKYLQMPE